MHRYVEHCQRHGLLPLLSIPVLGNPGQPEVCFWLVTTAKPKLYLKNDSAQEAVLQGSDSTPPLHLNLWLLGLKPVPFPKCLLVQWLFMALHGKAKGWRGDDCIQ